jgi:hypothetical protein
MRLIHFAPPAIALQLQLLRLRSQPHFWIASDCVARRIQSPFGAIDLFLALSITTIFDSFAILHCDHHFDVPALLLSGLAAAFILHHHHPIHPRYVA